MYINITAFLYGNNLYITTIMLKLCILNFTAPKLLYRYDLSVRYKTHSLKKVYSYSYKNSMF